MSDAGNHLQAAQYEVRPPGAPVEAGRVAPAAILVAHGMGQQIPFQTLDDVADGLCRAAGAARRTPRAQTVAIGGERLQRLDLSLTLPSGVVRDVHVYEAYWAPLTEGRVTLRDVISFLVRGALGGIRAGRKPFRRWLFGRYVRFPAPLRAVVYLELALAVVVALAILSAVIFAIAAARVPLHDAPRWVTGGLVQDVTTVLNVLICALVPLAAVLSWAWLARRAKRPTRLGVLSVATFVLALWAVMAAAVLVVAIIVYHNVNGLPDATLFDVIGWGAAVRRFDRGFDVAVVAVVAAAAAIGAVSRIVKTQGELDDRLPQNARTHSLTRGVRAGFLAIMATLALLAEEVLRRGHLVGIVLGGWHGLSLPLVVGVTLVVRSFFIEYAGDVAAYVQPQRLDRFFELRQEIKEVVWRAAKAVYGETDYDQVMLVGHSLGSVVLYDALNRLILDRQLDPNAPEILTRTRLFLSFGSPLDKTAFIFGIQGSGSEPREALAASVQPLLTEQEDRPVWINIWSPWDIISGSLDYYDLPDKSNRRPVDNRRDEKATTLLAAHVEYWNNPLLYQTIIDHL